MISDIERAALYFHDIEESIKKIREFIKDTTLEAFINDDMRQDAIHMRLLVIGEAVNNIYQKIPALLERNPEIPWKLIRGMRNKIAHEYFSINPTRTWNTIMEDLPVLSRALEKIRQTEPELAEILSEISNSQH